MFDKIVLLYNLKDKSKDKLKVKNNFQIL